MINKYLAYAKNEIKTELTDRLRFLIYVLSKPLLILIQVLIWNAIYSYSNSESLNGFTLQNTKDYFIFQVVFGLLTYSFLSVQLGRRIKSGTLSRYLLKPINTSLALTSINIGSRFFALFNETLPTLIIALVFFDFTIYNPYAFLISILSVFLGLLINCFFNLTWALMYFKILKYDSLERVKKFVTNFLLGYYLPINFMPEIFQKVLKYLPFNYILFEPTKIYLNFYSGTEIITILLIQVFWIVVFYIIFNIIFKYILKNFNEVGV